MSIDELIFNVVYFKTVLPRMTSFTLILGLYICIFINLYVPDIFFHKHGLSRLVKKLLSAVIYSVTCLEKQTAPNSNYIKVYLHCKHLYFGISFLDISCQKFLKQFLSFQFHTKGLHSFILLSISSTNPNQLLCSQPIKCICMP